MNRPAPSGRLGAGRVTSRDESTNLAPVPQPAIQIIGNKIIHLPSTTSTNDNLEAYARQGALPGLVVWADEQTQGRGRMGRTWNTRGGRDLLFSILLRPPWSPEKMTRLTILAAVAVARVAGRLTSLKSGGPRPTIKWPNDVLIRGKKVAGILVETRMQTPILNPQASEKTHTASFAILGIGLNVNSTSGDFSPDIQKKTTSLRIITRKSWNRENLLSELLQELDTQYHRALKDFPAVADEWADQCATIGKYVVASSGNRHMEGTAWRLDDDGALIVRTETGRHERILSGDVIKEKAHE